MVKNEQESDKIFFRNKDQLVEYVLDKILRNKKRLIGTRWTISFVGFSGAPISEADSQKAFEILKRIFNLRGYKTTYPNETNVDGKGSLSGINVLGLGMITLGMSNQFEFSASASEDGEEVWAKNDEFFSAICETAARLNYLPTFEDQKQEYLATGGPNLSLSLEWNKYLKTRFGKDAPSAQAVFEATGGMQIVVDAGGEHFHEIFQTLLLIKPALQIHYSNSDGRVINNPSQLASYLDPLCGVWHAKTATDAVEVIIDRLLDLEIPFLPDPDAPGTFKSELFVNGGAPSLRYMLEQIRLDNMVFDAASTFLLSQPSLLNLSRGLLKVTRIDSQTTPKMVAEIASRITYMTYNDDVRHQLLTDYAHLESPDLEKLYRISVIPGTSSILESMFGEIKFGDFMQDILRRSDPSLHDAAAGKFAACLKRSSADRPE